MNMKIASIKLLAAILFSAIVIVPLRAQTNAETTETSNAVGESHAGVPTVKDFNRDDASNIRHMPDSWDIPEKVVGVVAIVGSFGMVVAIIAMGLYARERRSKRLHETLRAMIDKGVPIPPEILGRSVGKSEDQPKHPRNDFRSGLILTGVGIGLVMFIGKVGWIVLFVGVAFLIASLVEKGNKNDDQPPKP